ncbi:flagellar basal-body rod protein FlgG [Novosphingobium rosa]|uniref:flagellar basal-body rod protein FlgG n=1 Tax=Novosphingobium rosa TaxID=76978 RepID=UPI00083679B1|nr:flagellar basal-body rod protein FlgG [Novosphingobium rosa]
MSASALQVARTGLDAQDTRMRVISNNLANVNTTAFKRDRANFATLAYQDMRIAGQQNTSQNNYATGLNLGTGVQIQSTSREESQGTLDTTGNAFDLAVQGEGYFQVLLPTGQFAYTRAGNFSLSAQGEIQTSDGYPVQPAITIPQGSTSVTVGSDGTVSAVPSSGGNAVQIGQITMATFPNAQGLQAIGGNMLQETTASGTAQIGTPGVQGVGTIKQGALETSNVNIVTELVDMIECQRAYEINSKMISSVDDMLKNANQTL